MTKSAFSDAAQTWNHRFSVAGYLFGTEPNAYLRRHAGRWQPGARLLCVADGEGRNSVWLARQGLRVDAFDISDVGVRKAQGLAANAGVHVNFAVADGDALAWPTDTYDGIVAIFIQFADPPMRERLFANMLRALKRGGLLVLQGYTPRQLIYQTGGPPFIDHLYTRALLRNALRHMQFIEMVSYEDELTEGTQHLGRSALIGLVARK